MGSEAFAELTRGPDGAVDLARAAMEIGRIVTPDLDEGSGLAELDRLADRVRAGIGDDLLPRVIADRTTAVLFAEEGYIGDRREYYRPENSSLQAVLASKRGNPVTLSVVVMEVAGRCGLDVQGVGAPAHFLVRFHDGKRHRFLDPFHEGREVSVGRLHFRVEQALGGVGSATAYLQAVTKRQILTRILTNMKVCCMRAHEPAHALEAVDYLLAMTPWALDEVRDRGFLLGRDDEALSALRQFRGYAENSADMGPVDTEIARIEQILRDGERG